MRKWLDGMAAFAMIVASGFIVWSLVSKPSASPAGLARPERPLPSEPVLIEGVAFRGDRSAPLIMTVFSDFECAHCARFARETLPPLISLYVDTGKVLLVFRHWPLAAIHPHAQEAAIATTCAARQGRFWELHDLLFEWRPAFTATTIRDQAKRAGLNPNEFETCVADPEVARQIKRDVDAGTGLGVTGTPASLIARRVDATHMNLQARIQGSRPVDDFKKIIASLIQKGG
jgi:protein-disulfide isomerase